ncbi:hypothetical protein LSH36_64g06043 [Paralvinella palmiformis]|uniref:C-type lectin domain-containing protein n=1 Tax=Paralvinella palmiformis TaxID=53620 RepID=A0AAD9NBZ7_9ANNE|nr:hypothetical protein LSH36_64g06043 [Paralvinella palmiformis]
MFGICTLLEEVNVVTLQTEAIPDENCTHYYWCPKNMVYFLRTGVCLANKTGLDWYEGEQFCKSIYPGAHLIDIKSEAEQSAYVKLYELFNLSKIWTSAKRPKGGARYEFYWTNSGKPLVYQNWHASQPFSAFNDSDCVLMSKTYRYKWDDNRCKSIHCTALCEW